MNDPGRVRPGGAADLPLIRKIQEECPEAAAWRAEDYLAHDLLVVELDGTVDGFAVARRVCAGESELLNLAVAARARRQGLGRLLLSAVAARHPGAIYLEVRESNTTARKFYKAFGFEEVGRRPEYYHDPPEAAVVMNFRSC